MVDFNSILESQFDRHSYNMQRTLEMSSRGGWTGGGIPVRIDTLEEDRDTFESKFSLEISLKGGT